MKNVKIIYLIINNILESLTLEDKQSWQCNVHCSLEKRKLVLGSCVYCKDIVILMLRYVGEGFNKLITY